MDFFNTLAESILENHSELDFYFVKAVLFSLFKPAPISQVALSWIKGEDNPDIKKAGLPEYSAEQQETKNVWVIKQICKIAELASLPVVIWFDQAESTNTDPDSGDSAAQIVARCIDRIYFDCTNVVLLCCLPSDRWTQIEQMRGGVPDRVGRIVLDAKPPTVEQMIELVRARLNWFFHTRNLDSNNYPFLYPIDESQIRNIAKVGGGVRTLLDHCAENFDKAAIPNNGSFGEIVPHPPIDPVEKKKKQLLDAYNELLEKISIPNKEDEKLAAIIICAMRMVPDSGASNVTIRQIKDVGSASSHDLHLIVSGYDSTQQKEVKIGIRICETKSANSFIAVMKRLLDYKKHKITRGCLVRSTPIQRNWKKGKELEDQLTKQKGGEVVILKKEEIRPLAALERIYQQSTDYDFERDEVISLVKELNLIAENKLICEILSAPI